MFAAILSAVLQIIPILPGLITDIEHLWSNKPKSGSSKWISVEQALSGSIEEAANVAAKLAPAGTKAETISTAIAVFTKDVNDAFVTLANDLQLFSHAGKPAANSAGGSVVVVKPS